MMALNKLLAAALVAALPLAGLAQTTPAEPAKPAEAAAAAPAPAPAAKPADDSIKVTPYGFVLLNMFYDMDTFATKDYPGAVSSVDQGEAFLGSARQSRFGVRLSGKDTMVTGADLSGVIEFDFKAGHVATSASTTCTDDGDATTAPVCTTTIGGGNTPSTGWYNGLMRLRLASATATWKSGTNSFAVLFGQDYGLVNPLFAESLAWVADPLFWQAGNLWRRTPQIRATYAGKFGDMGLTIQGAVLSPADATTPVDFGAGNASAMPDLEARAAFSAKFGDIGGTVGVGYHTEKREYQAAGSPDSLDDITTNLVGVDFDLNLTKFLQVKGEWYSGSGADDTYFGIAPSVSGAAGSRDTVDSSGFWAQALIKPSPLLTLTAGYGQATGDEDVITAATAREENTQLAFGAIVNAGKAWRFGVEYIQVKTTYGNAADFDGSQLAVSSMLRF